MKTNDVLKKLLVLLTVTTGFLACKQEVRYSQSSPEMDNWNQVVAKYESGNWEAFRMHFADTAKINTNSTNSVSPDELVAQHKETLAIYSTYGLVEEEGDVEMVVTDKGEIWVNFWGTWKSFMTANGKGYILPLHVTSQYIDAKIVKYYAY